MSHGLLLSQDKSCSDFSVLVVLSLIERDAIACTGCLFAIAMTS
ncbi:hypothetical protein [Microcoleus sp. FACHB-831]|nr:hypothetical protein [Microcoleus sp. FACHB-831]